MPKPRNAGKQQKPSRGGRKTVEKQPESKGVKPTDQEENFEHTLRRLVVARDGLERK